MTTIYQVVQLEDIPYERNHRNAVSVSLDLDEAIETAKQFAEKLFFNRYKEEGDIFFSDFSRFLNFHRVVPNLFSVNYRDHYFHELDVYVVAVKTGEVFNLFDPDSKQKSVWTIDEQFIFELFSKQLDALMKRDFLDTLSLNEKQNLWSRFLKNHKLLKNDNVTLKRAKTLGMKNRRRNDTDLFLTTLSGADVLAMTAANDEDTALFNRFER